MARLWSSGIELNSLTSGVEFTSVTNGAATIVTNPVRSGTYALRYSGFVSGVIHRTDQNFQASDNNGPFYARAYVRFATFPTLNPTFMTLASASAFTTDRLRLKITSGGVISMEQSNGTSLGSAPAISLNTWYRLEMKFDNTLGAGAGIAELRIDGVTVITSTTATLAAGVDFFTIGRSGVASTVGDYYFDDIAINDSTGSIQNSWPGAGSIKCLWPNAAGDNTTWTPSAGTNFAAVNTVPPDDDTLYNRNSVTLNQADDYNIDNSGIGSSDTVSLVQVGYRARGETSAASQYQFTVRVKKTSGGTISESGNQNTASTTYITNAGAVPRNYPLTLYVDPDGVAWTQSTLDSAQIGAKTSVTSTNRVRMTALWMLVEYVVAPMQTLVDNFTDNSTSAVLWPGAYTSSATYSETGGQVVFTCANLTAGTNYTGYLSNFYDLTSSYAYVQLVQDVSSLTNANSFLQLDRDSLNWVRWITENGTIYAQKYVNGTRNNVFSTTYSSTTHAWLRIRESVGTVYWDSAPDAGGVPGTWVNNGSETVANLFPVTSLKANFGAGTYQSELLPGTAIFDNFNTGSGTAFTPTGVSFVTYMPPFFS